jgi:hypothetical protein
MGDNIPSLRVPHVVPAYVIRWNEDHVGDALSEEEVVGVQHGGAVGVVECKEHATRVRATTFVVSVRDLEGVASSH